MRGETLFATGLLSILLVAGSLPVEAQCSSFECQRMLAPGGQFLDAFGRAASIAGDLAVVTADAEDDRGAAYAYRYEAGQWVQIQKIVPADIAIADLFGKVAQIVGQRMAIASTHDDDLGFSSGSVYAYEYDGAQWQQTQKLVASDGEEGDEFGWSLSMADDVLAVGALNESAQGLWTGAVYVFRHDGTEWVEEQKLGVSSPADIDQFGFSVATDGVVLVGGAPNHDAQGSDSGTAYVFRYDGSAWVEEQQLLDGDGTDGDFFGWSAAVDGDRIFVGSTNHDETASGSGVVYAWEHDGTSWVETDALAPAVGAFAAVGWSLSLEGDRLAVGVAGASGGHGAVQLYEHDGTAWVESCQLLGSGAPGDGMFNDSMGASVALASPHVIAGATFADGAAATDAGSAYAYVLDEDGGTTCEGPGAGAVPDGGGVPGTPLRIRKALGANIRLTWSASCTAADTDFEVYEGIVGDFESHAPLLCETNGLQFATITPGGGDRYYLVVPTNGIREGSYGLDGDGAERPASTVACLGQTIATCN